MSQLENKKSEFKQLFHNIANAIFINRPLISAVKSPPYNLQEMPELINSISQDNYTQGTIKEKDRIKDAIDQIPGTAQIPINSSDYDFSQQDVYQTVFQDYIEAGEAKGQVDRGRTIEIQAEQAWETVLPGSAVDEAFPGFDASSDDKMFESLVILLDRMYQIGRSYIQ